jgi:hypothetical protein
LVKLTIFTNKALNTVEKDLFINVLKRYPESSTEEAQAVLLLKAAFPYSQLLHALSARVAKDHDFSNHQAELQQAAVYAADRGVLREIMTIENFAPARPDNAPLSIPSVTYSNLPAVATVQEDNLADEVIHDLERLHELKANFELLFITSVAPKQDESTPIELEKTPAADEAHTPEREHDVDAEATSKDTTKSKKERIIELARAANQQTAAAETEVPATDGLKYRKRKKKDSTGEELIDEIVSTKEVITPENEKQKEQIELIEQFIRSAPSLAQTKEKPLPPPQGDLSTIKTGEFGDNVVSETLVEILLKQGKKDKAIEVLKKLIWKFPQKKAYFAAQIEDLKK